MILNPEWLTLGIAGCCGALVKDILKDNTIKLPHCKNGSLYLGCIGGMVIGALAGYLVDNDPVTAFLGGYAGYQIIESLINGKKTTGTEIVTTQTNRKTTEAI